MNKHFKSLLFLIISILLLPTMGLTQARYEIKGDGEASMRVLGTSTLHDWEMETKAFTGTADFVLAPGSTSKLVALKALDFAVRVQDLKSNNKGLDKNAYDALRADKHPTIAYQLSSATLSPQAEGYLLRTRGQLTIAGTTKEIRMDVFVDIDTDGTVTSSGSYTLKMSDYGVTPPSFMLGVMKTGDAITLEFSIPYQKSTGA